MKFKYIKNIQEREGTILLYDTIGLEYNKEGEVIGGIDGTQFAYEMKYLQEECDCICIRINSVGGSVLDGYSIISSILNSTKPVYTYVDGLAASIAGVIAVCGEKVYMMDYGTLMIHNPAGGNDKELLSLVKETLITILSNRSSLSREECSKMMDKETYFNAETAKKSGMVDEIVNSKNKVVVEYGDLYEMKNIYNKLINKNNKKEMNLIINKLGLDADSTEETIVEAIEKLQNKEEVIVEIDTTEIDAINEQLEILKNEKAELEAKLEEFNAEKAKEKADKIEEMVNSYITSGKLEEKDKDNTIKLASVDFDSVKNMLDKIGTSKSTSIMDVINKDVITNERASWTILDWQKNDPSGLKEINNTNPGLYNEMYNSFYNK